MMAQLPWVRSSGSGPGQKSSGLTGCSQGVGCTVSEALGLLPSSLVVGRVQFHGVAPKGCSSPLVVSSQWGCLFLPNRHEDTFLPGNVSLQPAQWSLITCTVMDAVTTPSYSQACLHSRGLGCVWGRGLGGTVGLCLPCPMTCMCNFGLFVSTNYQWKILTFICSTLYTTD